MTKAASSILSLIVLMLSSCVQQFPAEGDHIHLRFGIFSCSGYLPPLADVNVDVDGLHSHEDNLIHVHPLRRQATGSGATLDRFLDVIGVAVSAATVDLSGTSLPQAQTSCASSGAVIAAWSAGCSDTPIYVDVAEAEQVGLQDDGACVALVADRSAFETAGSPPPPASEPTDI